MKRVMMICALIGLGAGLSGCATLRGTVNCENGAKVREAAVQTIAALDFACPLPPAPPVEKPAEPPAADQTPAQ